MLGTSRAIISFESKHKYASRFVVPNHPHLLDDINTSGLMQFAQRVTDHSCMKSELVMSLLVLDLVNLMEGTNF